MSSLLEPRLDRRLAWLFWLFFLLILVRNAWLCEDAFISLRVVDNVVHGYGLRWNPLERVEVYTHPLWMLLLCVPHFIARDAYFAGMVTSIVFSALAVWLLLFRAVTTTAQCLLAIVLVTFSKAFVDYSTSGLENPLSHVLLLLFFVEYRKPVEERAFRRMMRWTALALFTRMDLIWLLLPAIVHVTWQGRLWQRRHWRAWLGLWPFVGWEVFSVLYYGFPFPNSAYAKLGVHVPAKSFITQGFYYLINSLGWDPLTLFAMTALVCLGFGRWWRHGERESAIVSLGVVLYMAYVIRVGGDYMSGRFLAVPFFASLLLLQRIQFESPAELYVALGVALAVGVSGPRPPILMSDQYVGLGSAPQWVDDERGFRHRDTSLMRRGRYEDIANMGGWAADGIQAKLENKEVVTYRNIGYFGFFAGPTVHVIDPFGIGDPLMARVHFDSNGHTWASGHFLRQVPDGYMDAAIDRGSIKDDALEAYWRKLEIVTRGPIFDPSRLALVVRFNLGLEPAP